MALGQAAVMAKIQDLLALETGSFQRVYSQGNTDGDELPAGALETPCAVIYDGGTPQYLLTQPMQKHVYDVVVLLMVSGQGFGERLNDLIGMKEACLSRMASNVKLGGLVVKCLFARAGRPGLHEWPVNGSEYTGQELVFEVEEQATANAAPGS